MTVMVDGVGPALQDSSRRPAEAGSKQERGITAPIWAGATITKSGQEPVLSSDPALRLEDLLPRGSVLRPCVRDDSQLEDPRKHDPTQKHSHACGPSLHPVRRRAFTCRLLPTLRTQPETT